MRKSCITSSLCSARPFTLFCMYRESIKVRKTDLWKASCVNNCCLVMTFYYQVPATFFAGSNQCLTFFTASRSRRASQLTRWFCPAPMLWRGAAGSSWRRWGSTPRPASSSPSLAPPRRRSRRRKRRWRKVSAAQYVQFYLLRLLQLLQDLVV